MSRLVGSARVFNRVRNISDYKYAYIKGATNATILDHWIVPVISPGPRDALQEESLNS